MTKDQLQGILEGIFVILLIFAFVAGVTAMFVGIWTDWRWSLTGFLACAVTAGVAATWNDLVG